MILRNGRIRTLDDSQPSAQALAAFNEHIVWIGSDNELGPYAEPTNTVIDLKGATVLPGFTDCHIHLLEYGLLLQKLDLRDVRSIEEMKQRVREGAQGNSNWILGRGWDQEKFAEGRYPTRKDLDEVCPKNPVMLRRVCGHICVVNSMALEVSNIDPSTPDPIGGAIDRDATGLPTGILREKAVELVETRIPDPTPSEYKDATLAACEKAVEAGLTTVHCIVDSPVEVKTILQLNREGRLKTRFFLLISYGQPNAAKQFGIAAGFGNSWTRFGGVKVFADGSLGARTAALDYPYNDDQENSGIPIYTQEKLDEVIADANAAGFQVAVHAIGDKAVKMALNSLEKTKPSDRKEGPRHRIEHASVLSPELIQRLKESGVIVTVQPRFVISDSWIQQRLGPERARFTYPFHSLIDAGILVVGSSDCPVEPLSPLSGIGAAVNRTGPEALEVQEAVQLYTRNAAYASAEENVKGTLAPGKYADLVVLEKDPFTVQPTEITEIKVLMTIVGGRVVYRSNSFL